MDHYDFLVSENHHFSFHHKFDAILIAKMLQSQGMKVGILNLFGEDKEPYIDGIPVVNLPDGLHAPDDSKVAKVGGNPIIKTYYLLKHAYQRHVFMKKVCNAVKDWADQFYCGSYLGYMSTGFMNLRKPCYYWGLRSYEMKDFWGHGHPIFSLNMIYAKWKFMRNPWQRLFVSNEFIKNEFVELGVPVDRMIIREERCIDTITDNNTESLSDRFSFLVIGQLRPDKQIDKTVNAFKKADLKDSQLVMVGKSWRGYEDTITSAIGEATNIVRENRYLEYDEFYKYFTQSHFVLFADVPGRSSITNGTMMEAFIHHRPIIAPNFNPFAYYINKYNLGILYDPNNEQSYINALKKAKEEGCEKYMPAINEFLKNILFDKVSKELYDAVKLS